jgi:O-antigen/teichoic acid export membrane protein
MKFAIAPLAKVRRHLADPLYKNSLFLILASAIGAPLGFVFWIVVAKQYSSSEVGLASAVVSAMGLLAVLSSLGFEIGVIRFLPQAADKRVMINNCLTITGTCSVLLSVVFIVGLQLWSPALDVLQNNMLLGFCVVVFTVVTALLSVQRNVFIALRSARFVFLQDMIWQLLKIILAVSLAFLAVSGIIFSWGIAICLALVIGNLCLVKHQPHYYPVPTISKGIVNDMLHFSLGNYLGNILSGAPTYVLPLMVVNILGAEPNAYFYMAYAIAAVLFMIPVAISQSLFAEGSHSPEKLRIDAIRAAKFTAIILTPLMIIILLVGDKLLLIFGQEYSQNASDVLRILSLSSIPLAFNALYVATKRVRSEIKPIIYTFLAITILTLGMSYSLMMLFGLTGVALGWTLSQTIVALGIGAILINKARRNRVY